MPELYGWYVYADFCSGRIWALNTADSSAPVLLAETALPIASFGELPDGELLALTFANAVYQLQRSPDHIPTTIAGGAWAFPAGSTGNVVEIELTDLPEAGLGDADIAVAFDSAVLNVTACDTGDLDGACNPNAPNGPARAAGFAAPAITTEPVVIATLTFDCVGAGGSSDLTITVNELMDGTAGSPKPLLAVAREGTVICTTVPIFSDTSDEAGLEWTLQRPFSLGIGWADYDNDGWPDAYYGRHGGPKASLYHNLQNGEFEDVGSTSGIQFAQDRHGCAWGDYDDDDDIDLLCTSEDMSDPGRLLRNNANGTFSQVADLVGLTDVLDLNSGRTATWLDYDGDGQLDLFHTGNTKTLLFRNLGGWPSGSFSDVTPDPQLGDRDQIIRSASSVDYDNDDKWDVFAAGLKRRRFDRQQIWLYRNEGNGGWQDESANAGIVLDAGHSGAWGDYDNDGWMDLFVGGCIQPDWIEPLGLFHNLGPNAQGEVMFENVTISAGIQQSPARMGVWGDYNNDGLLDLLVVNGVTVADGFNIPDNLYLNNGNGTFSDVASEAGIQGPSEGSGDGGAWADYNRDGFLDLLVANGAGWLPCKKDSVPQCMGPPKLYLNTPNGNHWLQIRLEATDDFYGFGSKVWATAGGVTQYRQLTDGVAGNSQNFHVVHLGLGDNTTVDTLLIRWPDGAETTLTDVAVDQELVLNQTTASSARPNFAVTSRGDGVHGEALNLLSAIRWIGGQTVVPMMATARLWPMLQRSQRRRHRHRLRAERTICCELRPERLCAPLAVGPPKVYRRVTAVSNLRRGPPAQAALFPSGGDQDSTVGRETVRAERTTQEFRSVVASRRGGGRRGPGATR